MSFGKLGALGKGFGKLGGLAGAGSPPGPTYDSDALLVFAAFTTPPTTARKTIINDYIVGLKADGIWSLLDLLYMTGAADAQAGTINWKSPGSFGLIAVNTPTFAADRGYTGDGASSRLRTQYTPSANGVQFQLNSASLWAWSLSNMLSSMQDAGSLTAPRVYITGRTAGGSLVGDVNSNTGQIGTAIADSLGMSGMQRQTASDRRLWKNGVQQFADTSASTSLANQEQWVCGGNATSFSPRQISMAAWGASLSGKELAFYNRTLTYMQAIGAA